MIPAIPHSRPWIEEKDRSAVASALASGMIAKGGRVAEFERETGNYLGMPHAIAQASGTAALMLALRTMGIGAGDEVVLPTYVCKSVLGAVHSVGATPVMCDVDETGVPTPETVAPHVTGRTKAVIAVHIFGHPCDARALRAIGIPVIFDACQAFGLSIGGSAAEALGDIGILSFHATKCLTTGEGGMLVTRDGDWGARARELADGGDRPPRHAAPLSDLQAALGLAQLSRYPRFLERRGELRLRYVEAARKAGVSIGAPGHCVAPFRFVLRTEMPFERVQEGFRERGVAVRRGVDELLHRALGMEDSAFPSAVRLFQSTVSVPFYPSLSHEESTAVENAIGIAAHDD